MERSEFGREANQGMSSCALLCGFLISDLILQPFSPDAGAAVEKTQEHSCGRPQEHISSKHRITAADMSGCALALPYDHVVRKVRLRSRLL